MVRIVTSFKNMVRFETLIQKSVKHGFGMIFDKISRKHIVSPEKHLRKLLEEMGGAFVKLGQLLSLRPDLIPLKYCRELEKLQENGIPTPFNKITKKIHLPIFKKINKKPLAVGTIAQVHEAELKTGKKVIIKIIKPNIRKQFVEDFELLKYLSLKLKKHLPSFIDSKMIIEEFKDYTNDELNFNTELRHLQEMKEKSNFKIPNAYEKFCSKDVLIMDFLEGVSLAKKPYSKWSHSKRSKLAKNIATHMMEDVFINGCFHADPHPGNIFLINENKFGLIDFGIVGNIDDETKTILSATLYALVNKNLDLLVKTLKKLGVKGNLKDEEFKEELKKQFGKYYDANLEKIKFGDLIHSVLDIGLKYDIQIPRNFVTLGKSVATFESVCAQIDPKFNFVKTARPFLKKNLRKLVSSRMFLNLFKKEVMDYGELFLSLPKNLKELVEIERQESENSKSIERVMEKLEVDLSYMQAEFFTFMFFVIMVVLAIFSYSTNISVSLVFGGFGLASLVLFLGISLKNVFK